MSSLFYELSLFLSTGDQNKTPLPVGSGIEEILFK
jgi:hypothetical protein